MVSSYIFHIINMIFKPLYHWFKQENKKSVFAALKLTKCIVFTDTSLLGTGVTMSNPYEYTVKVTHWRWTKIHEFLMNFTNFQDISYLNEGFYSCVAGNTLGETVSSAYLEIAAATLNILDIRIVTIALVVTLMGVRWWLLQWLGPGKSEISSDSDLGRCK